MKKRRLVLLCALGGALAVSTLGLARAGRRARLQAAGSAGPLTLTGVLEAREADLRVLVGGPVDAVSVEAGDRVAPGQVLATVDPREAAASLEAARGALAQSEAEQARLQAGARAEQRAEVEARVELARTDLQAGEREFARLTRLQRQGIASREALDQATSQRDRARAALRRAQAEQRLVEAGPRPEELDAAQAAVRQAAARVAQAELQLERTEVRAPWAGRVTERFVEPGETVQPGSLIVTVAREALEVKLYLREPDLGRVRPGAAVEVRCDAWPDRAFAGRVTRLASEAEFTPRSLQTREDRVELVFAATALLEPTDGLLPGMPVDVAVDVRPPAERDTASAEEPSRAP